MPSRLALWLLAAAALSAQNPLVFENDLVRVVKAANMPGQKSRPHVHLVNRVMVHLDKGELLIDNMETGPKKIPFAKGQVRWDPKVGLHTSENTGGTPIRIVEIEMKNAGVPGRKSKPLKGATIELENDQAAILRLKSWKGKLPDPAVITNLANGDTTWHQPDDKPQLAPGEWIVVLVKR